MDGKMSSMDESVINGCLPWIDISDDGHRQSISGGHREVLLLETTDKSSFATFYDNFCSETWPVGLRFFCMQPAD